MRLGNYQVREAQERRKPLHVPLQPSMANHVAAEHPLAIRNGCSTRARTLAFAVSAREAALSGACPGPWQSATTPRDARAPPACRSRDVCVSPDLLLLAVQKPTRRRQVVNIGGRSLRMVHQPPGVGADMQLHPKMPLVLLLRPVHLRISGVVPVPGRRRHRDDGGVNDATLLQQAPPQERRDARQRAPPGCTMSRPKSGCIQRLSRLCTHYVGSRLGTGQGDGRQEVSRQLAVAHGDPEEVLELVEKRSTRLHSQ